MLCARIVTENVCRMAIQGPLLRDTTTLCGGEG